MSDPPVFAIHGYQGVDPAREWGPVKAEFERRGFSCRIVRSPRMRTRTPHQDRARIMVDALRDVEGDVALIGISNHGLFMPLVAAARPVRRIVFVNGVIPRPGQSFLHATAGQRVWANFGARLMARRSPGMHEVCPLTELPHVEYVYISSERDEALRPEWEQWAAREFLHVEPVVVKGAGHASILHRHPAKIVEAATAGIQCPASGVEAQPC